MGDFYSQGAKLNRRVDFIAWLLVFLLIGATPFVVKMFLADPPPPGPQWNPSVLIMFLSLQSLIIIGSLWLLFVMWRAKARGSLRDTLPQDVHNAANVLCKFIGGLFIVSGFVKLQDITGFAIKLDEYWTVFGMEFMKPMSVYMAWFVSVFEVAIAFALMTGFKMRITTFFMLGMILFFTFLTGWSAITDTVTDCGCFGDALKLTPEQSFTKDVFLTIAILPLYFLRKKIQPFYGGALPLFSTFGSFALAGFLSWYTYQHLEFFDFRSAYKVGQNLEYNANNVHDGEIIAHDFFPFGTDCKPSVNDYEGVTLYIIMYNMNKADESAMAELAEKRKEWMSKAPGVKLLAGTNTGRSDRTAILQKYGLEELCTSGQDEKVLKTIIRSSPGYVLMKDGVILKKWHHNDIPSADELIALGGDAAKIAPPPPPPPVEPVPVDSTIIEEGSGSSGTIRVQRPAENMELKAPSH